MNTSESFPTAEASAGAVVEFQDGLPGFESNRQFVILSGEGLAPFTILQGLGTNAPSFAAVDPRRSVVRYKATPTAADLIRIGADESTPLLWLALVSVPASGVATVNLRAPVVINPATLRGVQLADINASNGAKTPAYRFDHPLRAA